MKQYSKRQREKQAEIVEKILSSVNRAEIKSIIKFCETNDILFIRAEDASGAPYMAPVKSVKDRLAELEAEKYKGFMEMDLLCDHDIVKSETSPYEFYCKKCGGWNAN